MKIEGDILVIVLGAKRGSQKSKIHCFFHALHIGEGIYLLLKSTKQIQPSTDKYRYRTLRPRQRVEPATISALDTASSKQKQPKKCAILQLQP
jgi:hypothetical protein